MKYQIVYERGVNVMVSSLAMVAQRLPFLKNLSPFFGATGGMNFAAPLTVTFVGTHALSGQSIVLVATSDSADPTTAKVGEQFVWSFKSSQYSILSFAIGPNGAEDLPPGLGAFGPQSGVGIIGGTPSEAGDYTLIITGYRGPNQTNSQTVPFSLTINVAPANDPLTPYEEFISDFWAGEDLENPLISGPAADPDLDGIDNAMEFVLDLDPTSPDAMPGTIGLDPNDPQMIRYVIPLNALASETAAGFEESTSMEGEWQPVSTALVERTDEMIVLTAPLAGRKFYRLKVTLE